MPAPVTGRSSPSPPSLWVVSGSSPAAGRTIPTLTVRSSPHKPGALMATPRTHLRIAYLAYRGNPHSGGQGVYTRYLTRELVALGHQVTVFGGQPYPVLDEGVEMHPLPSLGLYRSPDPFRIPHPREFQTSIDAAEFALMCTAGFPEPLTFSWRAHRELRNRRHEFDLIHDNQCLGRGLLPLMDEGWPLIATLHHPIT